MIISYKDFFDFEDTRSVSEIITFIDKLDKSYSTLADHVIKDLAEINKAKEKNIQVTKEWLKISESVNLETEKGRKKVQELSVNVNQLTTTQAKLISSQKQSEQQLKAINTETERLKKSKDELKKSNVAEAGSLAALKKELTDSIKAYDQLGDSADKSIKDEQLKKVKELSNQYSTQKRAIDEAKKATDFAAGSYNALNQSVIENTKKLKSAAVGINITEKEFEELRIQINKDNQALKEFDSTIGNNQRRVGAYKEALGGLNTVLGAAGITLGVYGAINAFKKLIDTQKEFEKSLSELRSLTGASAEDLKFYEEAAAKIGSTTTLSASEAVKAFTLIGSAKPDLLANRQALADVTQAAVTLAEASGLQLPEAADALTGALNQLSLPAEKASQVINALAAGSVAGASTIPQLNESLRVFGAVASSSNVSIEESVALIELLGDKQIKGSQAGTALRNVLTRLSAVKTLSKEAITDLQKYGVNLDLVSNNAVPLNQRLKEFGKISGDVNSLVRVFGEENLVAGQIVFNNIERFEELNKAVTGTQTAFEQAKINVDNLEGDLKKFNSVLEAVALDSKDSLNGIFRGFVQGATTMLSILRELPKFLKENKELFIALGLAILQLKTGIISTTLAKLKDITVTKLYAITTQSATTVTKNFFNVLKANPLGIILASITAVIGAIKLYDATSKRSTDIAQKNSEINKDLEKSINSVVEARNKLLISTDEFLKKSKEEQDFYLDRVAFQKKLALAELASIEIQAKQSEILASQLTLWQKLQVGVAAYFKDFTKASVLEFENRKKQRELFEDRINQFKEEIKKLDEFLFDSKKAQETSLEEEEGRNKERAKNIKKTEDDLARYKLQLAIEEQKRIVENAELTEETRINANKKLLSLEKQLAALIKKERLSDYNDRVKLQQDIINNEKSTVLEKQKAQDEILKIEKEMASQLEIINLQHKEDIRKIRLENLNNTIKIKKTEAEQLNEIDEYIISNEQVALETRIQNALDSSERQVEILELEKQASIEIAKAKGEDYLVIADLYNAKIEKLTEQSAQRILDIQIKSIEDSFSRINATIETQTTDTLSQLTAGYASGLDSIQIGDQLFDISSFQDFENSKTELLRKAEEERLRLQLNYALDQLNLLDTTSKEYLSKKEEIAKLEQQLTNNLYSSEVEKRKFFEEELARLSTELKQAAVSSALTIIDNANAAEDQKRAERLARLEEQQEIELTLAGNNEVAKAEILNKFAAEEEKIRQQQAAANRKRAVFEKLLAATEIGINTAIGISKAIAASPLTGGLPFSAIIAAIGAVQLAAVLSKPIPAFEKGTDYSPEGLAIVNEGGRELITEPSGKSYMVDSEHAALTYLKKGSKVYTSEETQNILSGNHFDELGRSFRVKETQNDQRMILAMSSEFGKLNRTIQNKKEVHLNVTKEGVKTIIKDNGSYIEYLNMYYQ